MYSNVTTVNNIVCLRCAQEVNIKCSHQKKKKRKEERNEKKEKMEGRNSQW